MIPDEILIQILLYLSAADLIAFSKISRKNHIMASDDILWVSIAENYATGKDLKNINKIKFLSNIKSLYLNSCLANKLWKEYLTLKNEFQGLISYKSCDIESSSTSFLPVFGFNVLVNTLTSLYDYFEKQQSEIKVENAKLKLTNFYDSGTKTIESELKMYR
jgi:hypothetical protein